MDHIVQNQPGSNLDGLVRVWPNTSGLEASWCAGMIKPLSGRTQPACYQTRFHSSTDVPDNIVQNQPGSYLVLADCVRFWPNGSGPEASRCARIIQPASGQCFPADPDRILYREHASELSSPGSQHKLPQHFYCWKMATNGTDLMGYDSNSHFAFQLVKK